MIWVLIARYYTNTTQIRGICHFNKKKTAEIYFPLFSFFPIASLCYSTSYSLYIYVCSVDISNQK
jgi:hypothetical protein